ncbi:MAG: transglutaminase family protein [Gammaproteobacteria bacterium]
MKYRIVHVTTYHYSQPVGLCQNEARLQPRDYSWQQSLASYFEINPTPTDFRERIDFFGNRVAYFAIQQVHSKLTVTAISEVQVMPEPKAVDLSNSISWEQARENLLTARGAVQDDNKELMDARQYTLDSPMVVTNPELAAYAQASFMPGRPLLAAVQDLVQRIFSDFTYDPAFTTIATPLSDVLLHRRGVCQDFAHLAIGCLRSYGLAARYVSGYVESIPAPGAERIVGGDASHAWFAVFIPGSGWLDFDPTNNQMPLDQHVTLAWGRDYTDVTPLKGIAYGGGKHTLSVSVDVQRL